MFPERCRHLIPLTVRLLALPVGAFLLQPGHCGAVQITWTNIAGGNWSVPANWSPNQVPSAGDTANITNPGTYAVTLDINETVGSLVVGGAISGVQTLQAYGVTLAAGQASLNSGGVMELTNSTLTGAVTVAGGGWLIGNGTTIGGQVTVESGGEFLVLASTTLGQGGQPANTNDWLWVQSGGLVSVAYYATLYLYAPMTNSGLVNLTNYGLSLYNNGFSGYTGGVANQSGGTINFISTAGISSAYGSEYLVNQGTINVTGGNSTIGVWNLANQGVVATMPGTGMLRIGNFNGLGSLTGTYNAAAGTTIQFVGGNSPGTSPGTPLVLGGAGQYQFGSGTLMLTTNVIPGVVMTGGNLILGPAFEGGAITNLVLDGITLTNNLPIGGTLTMTNGTLLTTSTLTNMTVLSLNNVTMYGAINVAAGGLLSCNSSTLGAQVSVESGGEFLVLGSSTIGQGGQPANTNDWLWVQSGGLVSAAYYATLYLYAPMTNSGLVNLTNYGLSIYNNGSSGYTGGVLNEAGATINLISTAGISSAYGSEYLINQGTINVTGGNSTIGVWNLANEGLVATMPGTGTLRIGSFNGLGSLNGTYSAAAGTTIQFVGGNNPGTSAGTPLVLGGAGQYQFVQGTLTLTTNVIPGVVMTGGNLILGPTFQGGAITNLTLNGITLTNNLPIGGALIVTNGTLVTTSTLTNMTVLSLNNVAMYGAINVAAGGLLSCNSSSLGAQITVENGGELLLLGSTTIGQSGQSANANDWLWVQNGGELDAAYTALLSLYTAMTNAGLANFTNYGISMYNNGSIAYNGGVWNEPSGVLNLISTAGISGGFGASYLVNQGTINVSSGNSTIGVDNVANTGNVNTLPGTGTLRIGTFSGLGSLTGTYNAAAGTTIQFVGSNTAGTSAGTPLVLGGAGQYQFVLGTLLLPIDVIPGVVMTGGNLVLGASFQGGAITNLTLNGITLTNTLPIAGTLSMTNGTLVTTSTLTNMTVLNLNSVALYGAINVAAGGLLNAGGATLAAQVTVESGGKLLLFTSAYIGQGGQASNINDWLWVQSGGELDASENTALYLYSAMTNAGLANMTNYGITIYNNSTSAYSGSVWNQAGGVINLLSSAQINGGFGYDYLVNQGTINSLSPNSSSTIYVTYFTNAATVNALYGLLQLQSGQVLQLEPSGTLSVGLSSPTVYGVINIPGHAVLGGAFGATLLNEFVPPIGTSFNVVTYGSFSGAFSDTNFQSVAPAPGLPGVQHTAFFHTTYTNTFMTITAQQITEQFVFGGTNGPPGHQYVVLTSTDLALPRAAWTPVVTNYFGADGGFTFTNNLDLTTHQRFFSYRYQ